MSAADHVPTESAVVVLVPAAEPSVASLRLDLDPTAAWGVPSHVTVLYPFVQPARLDDTVMGALAAAVRTVPRFTATFRRAALVDEAHLWLLPEPEEAFRRILSAVHAAFPAHLPYGGRHADPTPHLTVGQDVSDGAGRLSAARDAVSAALPVTQDVTGVAILAGTRRPRSWLLVGEVPLGV